MVTLVVLYDINIALRHAAQVIARKRETYRQRRLEDEQIVRFNTLGNDKPRRSMLVNSLGRRCT